MKLLLVLVIAVSGCQTTKVDSGKSTWKVSSKNSISNKGMEKSTFVPSGTELIFTAEKTFSEKDNQINIELSPEKRCTMSSALDKQIETKLSSNAILTVVGYRGETNELVLSEPSYQQYFISCVSKTSTRKMSSVKPKKSAKMVWKKSSVEIDDIEKMSPLLKVKFIPQ